MHPNHPRIVVLGGSFAGLTAALELKRLLKEQAEVTLISKQDHFVFIPSLIWVPSGWREPEDISFKLQPTLNERGIMFLHVEDAEWAGLASLRGGGDGRERLHHHP